MKGDVFPASFNGILLAEKIGPSRKFIQEGGPAAFHPVHYFLVLKKKSKEGNQVRGIPVSSCITISHPQGTSEAGFTKKIIPVNFQICLQTILIV